MDNLEIFATEKLQIILECTNYLFFFCKWKHW